MQTDTTETVPRLSLQAARRGTPGALEEFAATFLAAFRTYGFAIITDHGIDHRILQNVRRDTREFFDRPGWQKLAFAKPHLHGKRGYMRFGSETAVGAASADLKEFFHIGRHSCGDNIWPSGESFRDSMDHFFYAADNLANLLLHALDIALGEVDTLRGMAERGNSVLRLIHYPPFYPEAVSPNALRSAAHEDINLLTVLSPGFVPGDPTDDSLHIFTRTGHWIPVCVSDGDLVINAGDMLKRITAGEIPSTTHRVVRPLDTRKSRYSFPFFVHPRPEVTLHVLSAFAHLPHEPDINADDFLNQRLTENYRKR